jgi:hypothetical protein
MPKSLRMRSRRNRKGGMWPFDSSSSSNNGYSATTQGSSWYDNLNPFGKKDPNTDYPTSYPTSSPNSYTPTSYPPNSYPPTSYGMGSSPSYGMGGKRRRGMRGGSVSPNMSLTNLASSAAPISGGRTRRRYHRHTKSCKKSCKKR